MTRSGSVSSPRCQSPPATPLRPEMTASTRSDQGGAWPRTSSREMAACAGPYFSGSPPRRTARVCADPLRTPADLGANPDRRSWPGPISSEPCWSKAPSSRACALPTSFLPSTVTSPGAGSSKHGPEARPAAKARSAANSRLGKPWPAVLVRGEDRYKNFGEWKLRFEQI